MERAKIYKDEEYAPLINALQPRYSLIRGMTNHHVYQSHETGTYGCCVFTGSASGKEIRNEIGLIGYRDAVSQIHFRGNTDLKQQEKAFI